MFYAYIACIFAHIYTDDLHTCICHVYGDWPCDNCGNELASVCLSVCLSVCMHVCMYVCMLCVYMLYVMYNMLEVNQRVLELSFWWHAHFITRLTLKTAYWRQ